MDARLIDKSKLPSRHVTEGPERAPHRSYYYAMGLTAEQIHQPFVGVATCWNEAAPCNIALMRQAQAVKKGVAAAGGTPREFCTITVTDGIAMGHQGMKSSLPSREVIADSVELTMRGHAYDALVGLAGCDKSLPGMMMAMCRLNVPSIFIYGGSILPGTFKGKPVTVQDVFEAVGKYSVGAMSDEDLEELEQVACPSAGACGAQFTANTMATVSEAIGLALPYSAGAPAPLRSARPLLRHGRRDDHGTDRAADPPARHRHPQGARERRDGGGGLRRLHQRGAASAGHRARVRHQLRPVRRRRNLQAHALRRRPEARRALRRQGPVRGRRHSAADEDAARPRLPARRLPDRDRPHHGREPGLRAVERRPGRGAPGGRADHADRRRRRPEGQPRPRGRDREGRRHAARQADLPRPGALLRRRGGLLRGGPEPHATGRARCW